MYLMARHLLLDRRFYRHLLRISFMLLLVWLVLFCVWFYFYFVRYGGNNFVNNESNVDFLSSLFSVNVSVDSATIFVSIASFRDSECAATVSSLFTHATNPHRVFLGISEERFDTDPNCIIMDSVLSKIGLNRVRTLRWRDVVPSAYETNQSNISSTHHTPLLHAGRDDDVITCLLAPDVQDVGELNSSGSVLKGCQVITRVGNPDDARGPIYGRYLSGLFYNNQDYYMIIDSHSRFVPGWEVKMIYRARLMPTRGVLSYYPNTYTPENLDAKINLEMVTCLCRAIIPADNIPRPETRWILPRNKPVLQGFVAGGYVFGDAQFVKDVPLDPYLPFLFSGEEILYTARLWTSGWDSYSPAISYIFHYYGRKNAPKFWSVFGKKDVQLERMRALANSKKRLFYFLKRNVLNSTASLVTDYEAMEFSPAVGLEAKRFGMGYVRSLAEFWRFVELSDEFIKKKDNKNCWMGGEGLCRRAQHL